MPTWLTVCFRFLSGANWMVIDDLFHLDLSFIRETDDAFDHLDANPITKCPECQFPHPNSPTKKELYELADDCRYSHNISSGSIFLNFGIHRTHTKLVSYDRMLMLQQEGVSYLQQNTAGLISATISKDLYSSCQVWDGYKIYCAFEVPFCILNIDTLTLGPPLIDAFYGCILLISLYSKEIIDVPGEYTNVERIMTEAISKTMSIDTAIKYDAKME